LKKEDGNLKEKEKEAIKIYKHPDFKDPISVPFHGKKDLGKGLLQKLMKQAGLK
jgi:predicted RNA binding protein YcfA (HicA-like mRNA interferase family)